MSRKGHYLKRSGRGTCPGLVVSVVVSDRAVHGEEADPRCRTREFHSVAVAWSYHSHGTWTPARTARFGDVQSFWRWLDGMAKAGRRVYCFAPIASDALTLLGFWKRATSPEPGRVGGNRPPAPGDARPAEGRAVAIQRLVLAGRPDVIGYLSGGRSFIWLSGRQFWDESDDSICDRFPARPGSPDERPAGGGTTYRRPTVRAVAWLNAMTCFATWWRSLGAGPFPRTVPGGAMQYFRSRMTAKSIVVHRDEEPYRLERLACHGGRASCWYYGKIVRQDAIQTLPDDRPYGFSDAELVGPVHRVDVRSMYPALLRDREYPVRLVKYGESYDVADLVSLASRYGVIARVDVDTDDAEYPVRDGDGVVYPVGRFATVVCSPELTPALRAGLVKRVWEVAAYEMGRPFERAAGELCDLRQSYRRPGCESWELLTKTLGNSLAGKLAQRPRGWQEVPGVGHYPEWDVWIDRNTDTGTTSHFRCIAGRVYENKDIGVGQGTLTAAFAFLTSYGRARMRAFRELCPSRTVISQDTDGLWILSDALISLQSCGVLPTPALPGELRLIEAQSEGYWLGPKHYRTLTGWTLAGYHSPGPPRAGLIRDTYDVNPVRTGCTEPPTTVEHWIRSVRLPKPPRWGTLGGDGWLWPERLPRLHRNR